MILQFLNFYPTFVVNIILGFKFRPTLFLFNIILRFNFRQLTAYCFSFPKFWSKQNEKNITILILWSYFQSNYFLTWLFIFFKFHFFSNCQKTNHLKTLIHGDVTN